ncbi:MAG: hypothetical protein ACI9S9_002672 [Planctomycetota bacterium]|jgi:hypothetical protein
MRELRAVNTSLVLSALLGAMLSTSLVAQKLPDPHDNRRLVQLHDASEWLDLVTERLPPKQRNAAKSKALTGMATFASHFIEPPLQPGADIVVMAQRYVVAIAGPQQQAWIERLLARHLSSDPYRIDLQLQQFAMSAARFKALVAPLVAEPTVPAEFGSAPAHTILLGKRAEQLAATLLKHKDIKLVNAPRVLVPPMTSAVAKLGRDLIYVQDFDVQVGNADFTATPIHASIFDGLNLVAPCGRLADGKIGVGLNLTCHKVEQPFATFETTLGVGNKVTIELPSSKFWQWRRNIALPDGGAALCSWRDGDEYVVLLLRAREAP